MKTYLLAAFITLMFTLPVAAADISGSWTITGEVYGNAINIKCAFTQDGPKVGGSCAGPSGTSPTSGRAVDDKVTFTQSVERDQVYELTYSGTLDAAGTSMKGEIAVMGVTGTFTGTKDAVKDTTTTIDVAGNWTFTGDVIGNPISMKCSLKRDGTKLSGTCTYREYGVSPTTGSVVGDKVTLQNRAQKDQVYDLTYNGTLDPTGTSMNGDIAVEGVTGTFSGAKDK